MMKGIKEYGETATDMDYKQVGGKGQKGHQGNKVVQMDPDKIVKLITRNSMIDQIDRDIRRLLSND